MPRKKKAVEKPPTPPELLLTYRESRSGGAAIDPGDKWSDHEDEIVEFSIIDVFVDEQGRTARQKCKDTWYTEKLDNDFPVKPGDRVWVVVIRYTTGGTFGRTCGAWQIEGVYKTAEEATKIENAIWADEKAYREWRWRNPSYHHKKKEPEPEEQYKKYKCWRGYFESLENVEVESFTVL